MKTNNIEKIKKYFYSGVGFVAHSSDIIKSAVDEIVSQGKLSEKDGQKIVSDAIGKIETRYQETMQKLGDYAISEISVLRKKVEGLESRLEKWERPASTKALKTVKKVVASKPTAKKTIRKAPATGRKTAKPAAKKTARKKA